MGRAEVILLDTHAAIWYALISAGKAKGSSTRQSPTIVLP
jgi:PIN domain nuclease of toxin-antitoxin system